MDLVIFFRARLSEYHINNGTEPTFRKDFNDVEFKIAMHFLSSIDWNIEEIKEGIIWFFKDEFWQDKITSLAGVEKHFMRYQIKSKSSTNKNRDWLMGCK